MKEMSKSEIIKWWGIFEPSPWAMFIHVEMPTFGDGKTLNGLVHAYLKDGKFFPVTGCDEIDKNEIVNAQKYHCDVN